MDIPYQLPEAPALQIASWIETCGNCRQRFAIAGGAGPQSKFEDIRCPSCHAFWGRSPSDHGFSVTVVAPPNTPA